MVGRRAAMGCNIGRHGRACNILTILTPAVLTPNDINPQLHIAKWMSDNLSVPQRCAKQRGHMLSTEFELMWRITAPSDVSSTVYLSM